MPTQTEIVQSVLKAEQTLVDFRHILLTNGPDEVEPAPFHHLWSKILLDGSLNEAIQGHRESAKTQYVLRAFLAHAIMFPSHKRDYIVIIKKNTTLARNILRETEHEAESNPAMQANCDKVLECSGDVYSVDRVAKNGEIMNVRIEAYGKGAAIRGLANRDRRPKIVIIDDPQDVEDAKSETVQANDWNWFLSDVLFLGQKSRIFLIGNNLGEKSIIERVFANAERLNFHTSKVPQVLNGQPAWAAKYTMEEIEKEKKAFREMGKLDIWLRERMCEAVSDETRTFNPNDYRYFGFGLVNRVIQGCNRFATLDPASSPDPSSCYRAIVVNAVSADNYWNIIDVPYGRWDSIQLIDNIFKTVTKWSIKEFGIEKGQFKQIIEPFIYKEMAKRNIFFNIIPIEHAKAGTKLERIKMLQPRFKAHTIWFPTQAPWLVEMEAELAGVTKDAIKSLYIDLVDCLAMQEQIAKAPFNNGSSLAGVAEQNREQESEYDLLAH